MKTDQLRDPSTEARARRMIKKIRDLYDAGARANAKPEIPTAVWAETEGVTPHVMARAKRAARVISREELDWFCSLRRPSGLPPQWLHLSYLLTIDDPQERKKWAERATREDWTAQQMHVRIVAKRGPKLGHGRKVQAPKSAREGLEQLAREGDLWAKRAELVIQRTRKEAGAARNRKALRRPAKDLLEIIERLQRQCRGLAKELDRVASGKSADRGR